MKIDRDNFRHLTGFGRDMANYVEAALTDIDANFLVTGVGNLIVHHDRDINIFSHKFLPFEDVKYLQRVDENDDQYCLSIIVHSGNGYREITSVPLAMLFQSRSGCYHIYQHHFIGGPDGERIKNELYTGVTKRGWRTRWAEHLRAAETGSHCLFHGAIRKWHGTAKTIMHAIVGVAVSESRAMEIEEFFVERDSYYPNGLNMIPGGYAGIARLRNLGLLGKRERVGVDDVDAIINRYCERASRKGESNLKAALNWLTPGYAEKVICGGSDRLKPQQIRDARSFASFGGEADDIAMRIGARNTAQVRRLLSGQTYSRIL